jgi:hypothetical protein
MPVLFAVILGGVPMVVGVYAYDTATGRVSNALPPSATYRHPPSDNWRYEIDFRDAGAEMEGGWKQLASWDTSRYLPAAREVVFRGANSWPQRNLASGVFLLVLLAAGARR